MPKSKYDWRAANEGVRAIIAVAFAAQRHLASGKRIPVLVDLHAITQEIAKVNAALTAEYDEE